jgi:hypothetical protein
MTSRHPWKNLVFMLLLVVGAWLGKTQFLIDGFLSRPSMMRSMRLETDAHQRVELAAGIGAGRVAGIPAAVVVMNAT